MEFLERTLCFLGMREAQSLKNVTEPYVITLSLTCKPAFQAFEISVILQGR